MRGSLLVQRCAALHQLVKLVALPQASTTQEGLPMAHALTLHGMHSPGHLDYVMSAIQPTQTYSSTSG